MTSLKLRVISSLIAIFACAATTLLPYSSQAADGPSCEFVVANSEAILKTIDELARLHINIERAKATGSLSLAESALSHDFLHKYTELTSLLAESVSALEIQKMIRERVAILQGAERGLIEPKLSEQDEKLIEDLTKIQRSNVTEAIFSQDSRSLYVYKKTDSALHVMQTEPQLTAVVSKEVPLDIPIYKMVAIPGTNKIVFSSDGIVVILEPETGMYSVLPYVSGRNINVGRDGNEVYGWSDQYKAVVIVKLNDLKAQPKILKTEFSPLHFMNSHDRSKIYVVSLDVAKLNAATYKNYFSVFDRSNLQEIRTLQIGLANDFDVSPDDKTLAVVSDSLHVHLYDLETGIERFTPVNLKSQAKDAQVAFSTDGKFLAVGHDKIEFFETRTFKKLKSNIKISSAVRSLEMSPDGNFMSVKLDNNILKVIDLRIEGPK